MPSSMPSDPKFHREDGTGPCCGTVRETLEEARFEQARPRSWIARKLMVPFTGGLFFYGAYVYISQLCYKLIRHRASRAAGVSLLLFFSILFFWTMWAYIKVVSTSPGFARDHIPKSDRPYFPDPPRPQSHLTHIEHNYDPENMKHNQIDHSSRVRVSGGSYDPQAVGGPVYTYRQMREQDNQNKMRAVSEEQRLTMGPGSRGMVGDEEGGKEAGAGVRQEKNLKVEVKAKASPPASSSRCRTWISFSFFRNKSKTRAHPSATVHVARRPSRTPMLHPAYRYCSFDEIVKPYRAHHCRSCGTCVLKYDHHCPWIGQCVGARNQKFFINFLQAASLFTLYCISTILPFAVAASSSSVSDLYPGGGGPYLEVQLIVVVALAGAFAVFTVSLLFNNTLLIWRGQTTVESIQANEQEEREARALQTTFGFCAISEKRRVRKEWDREWGSIRQEGNIWWLENGRAGWEDVMGRNRWGWLFPIGRSMSDGLHYTVNPRFDEEGRWQMRVEWPKDFQGRS